MTITKIFIQVIFVAQSITFYCFGAQQASIDSEKFQNLTSAEISQEIKKLQRQGTEVILDVLSDEDCKTLLLSKNESESGMTQLLSFIYTKNYDAALKLLSYTEQRFGREFVKTMILTGNIHDANALGYAAAKDSFQLMRTLLDYVKDYNVRAVVKKQNKLGNSPFDLADNNRNRDPKEGSVGPLAAIFLCFQDQYKITLEDFSKEFYGPKYWARNGPQEDIKEFLEQQKQNV